MADKTGTQPTTQPVPGAGQQDPEAGRIQSIEEIQREQREQRGLIEQLLTRIPGASAATGGGGAAASSSTTTGTGSTAGLDIGSIQAEVRRQIDEADRRREADKADRDWREDVTKTVEQVKAEKQPREPQTGVRAVLRRALVGKDA